MRELLRAGRRRTRQVVMAEGSDESAVLGDIADLARQASTPIRFVPRQEIESRARTDAPQGVIAWADPLPEVDLDDLVGQARPLVVVLDGVTDPHNVGAVMRSALAAGATGMVVGRHRSAGLGPSAVKAAAGAAEHLPVAEVAGIPAALTALARAGLWTVALDAQATTPLWGLEVATEPVALVLGDEGRGLSRLARERCQVAVGIPLHGPLGSLNVSAAATLACFEVARRRTSD